MPPRKQPVVFRFARYVDPRPLNGCWIWRGARDPNGYGRFTVAHRQVRLAHRVAYELLVHPLPDDAVLRHSCDNPSCVNPAHLLIGTQADNVRDMFERGRAPNRKRTARRGADAPGAKLTIKVVREIRRRAKRGDRYVDIAKDVGCSDANVSMIARGLTWKEAV